ncbi:MAG: squalene/phytoene synthase family protein [Candidatus Eremiobacteraeota bacterium]|nr:squalene/phytoene synthase family protein [Candidatus Eremiobacteraeota bacterium]MCW5869478.1 squalene/phytoene synthase family protein [Candidatus Eremiobacteraeota bacterium]
MNSQQLLKATSRAFYLSLRVLPPGARQTMSLAYLLARCADSISDGQWLDAGEREATLRIFLECLNGASPDPWRARVAAVDPSQGGEAALLHHLPVALEELNVLPAADQRLIRDIVTTLSQGMLVDLERFPGAVLDAQELRRHLWAAAGCVGAFWTAVMRLHEPRLAQASPQLEELGTRLGNALQLTNVLRDISGDLREGRCYLPAQELQELGLNPEQLHDRAQEQRLQPLIRRWLAHGYEDFQASRDYMLLIPWNCWRLRLAALWPWCMGVATLIKISPGGWLSGSKIKVTRPWVYRMLLTTALLAPFTPLLRLYLNRQLSRLRKVL